MCHTTNLLLILISINIFPFFTNGALQPQHQHAHGGGCIPAERAALLSFKEGITSNNTNLLTSWQGQDCCRWRGVSCSNRTGHVIKLHLRNPNVALDTYGYHYPCDDANSLFGEISPSLLSLKHLEHLDLSWNCLLGTNSQIPHFLGSMGDLRYLNLSGIPFTGRVPSQLGNLSKLQYLDLAQVDSRMYSKDITWLEKLPFLKVLSMSGVNLPGIADWAHTLNMIPSLGIIDLSFCSLDSANQSLLHLNLTKLEKLDLSSNYFEHSLTSGWFWKATSLKYLNLGNNRLFGQFPSTLGNMTYLQVLDISENENTDMMMTGNLENLCSLEILDLSRNEINGDIAVLMESLSQCTWKNLQELDLSDNDFIGTLPNSTRKFTSLNMLDLSMNNLNGSIPPGIGYLTRLTALDLSNNLFSATLPFEIGSLTDLISLDLSNNNFYGSLVPQIGALTNLTSLVLRSNFFYGSLPTEIGALTRLTSLDLSSNQLNGSLPTEFGALTRLTSLDLSSNQLNGSVPAEISYLTSLISLDLSSNNFSGMITEEHFIGLKNLKSINLSFNSLKIVLGSEWLPPYSLVSAHFASSEMGPLFPAWLQQQPEITELSISSTALKGDIPDWFWSTFSQATYLDISNNQLCGNLPADLEGMAVETLLLSSNRFTGPIPLLPRNIENLDISNNSFSGKLPSNIGGPDLEMFLMYSNQIEGRIPESMCKLQSLLYLDLSNNILEGEIPQCFDVKRIQFLLLSNNRLSGKFPAFLQNSTNLKFLDLASNKFSGRLPTRIGEMRALRFVLLNHNALSGTIPVEITNLGYLQFLDLSGNNFSGPIPLHLSNLTFMKNLQGRFLPSFDQRNYFQSRDRESKIIGVGHLGEILSVITKGQSVDRVSKIIGVGHLGEILSVITKGQKLIYGKTIAYFVNIDLSSNSLTGEIPRDITSLAALMNLNLSSNKLTGQIPNMIGALQLVVSLDLSQNKLSGGIPSSLSSITSLSYLNLSYNSLSGRIPSGRQLDTLNSEYPSLMYIGNSGLCGPPVHKNCSGNDPFIHGDLRSSNQEFDPLTFYFGLVLGFVVGLWMVFCALLFKKTWRIAYFRLFDKAYDQVYVFVVVKWASITKNTDAE